MVRLKEHEFGVQCVVSVRGGGVDYDVTLCPPPPPGILPLWQTAGVSRVQARQTDHCMELEGTA